MDYESNLELHNALLNTAQATKEHVEKHSVPQDHELSIDVVLPQPSK